MAVMKSPFAAFVQGLEIARQTSASKRQKELTALQREELESLKKQREARTAREYGAEFGYHISGPEELQRAMEVERRPPEYPWQTAAPQPPGMGPGMGPRLQAGQAEEVGRMGRFGLGEKLQLPMRPVPGPGARGALSEEERAGIEGLEYARERGKVSKLTTLEQQRRDRLELEAAKHENLMSRIRAKITALTANDPATIKLKSRYEIAEKNFAMAAPTDEDYALLGITKPKEEEGGFHLRLPWGWSGKKKPQDSQGIY